MRRLLLSINTISDVLPWDVRIQRLVCSLIEETGDEAIMVHRRVDIPLPALLHKVLLVGLRVFCLLSAWRAGFAIEFVSCAGGTFSMTLCGLSSL